MNKRIRKEYCGIFGYRPVWIQMFGTVEFFTFFACIIVAIQGMYLGYFIGIITTVEKRFKLPSTSSGALLSAYDVGHAISVLLVGHYGFWVHKAKWVAIGGFLSCVGCFGLALPQFLFGSYDKNDILTSQNDDVGKDLCFLNSSFYNLSTESIDNGGAGENNAAYGILMIFQILCGLSSSPFTTLTYVYIDDNATKKQSPFYLGLMSAMWAFGPALGFGLAALCTQTFVTLGTPPTGVTPDTKTWIGAWWLGLIILSVLYLIFAVPFLFFPKNLKRVRAFSLTRHSGDSKRSMELMALKDLTTANTYITEKKNVKWFFTYLARIPLEVVYLCKNTIVLTLVLSWVCWAYIIGGYSTFLPKYLESQFYQRTHLANIYGGLVVVLGVATATAIGGKILSHFHPRPYKALLLVVITGIVCGINYLILIFIDCPNVPINGMDLDKLKLSLANSTSYPSCTDQCLCSSQLFDPQCVNGETFYSPCFAGCTDINKTSCLCAPNGNVPTAGYCQDPCGLKMIFYLVAAFLSGFVGALFQMAQFTTVIWAVPVSKKTVVLALSNFFTSVLGFMPSQVLYGKIVDTACAVWSNAGDESQNSYCLIYDNSAYRNRYHLTTAMFQFISMFFVGLACYFSKNYPFHLDAENEDDEDGVKHDYND